MDDPLLVRRLQRLGDLPCDRERFGDRNRAFEDPGVQPVPFHQLHHEKMPPGGLLERVDRRDARMVQRGEGTRFPLETCYAVPVFEEFFRQDLQRDVAPELRVLRPVDLPHPARAERRDDLVGPEPCCPSRSSPGSPQDRGPVRDDDAAVGLDVRRAADHEKSLAVRRDVIGMAVPREFSVDAEPQEKEGLRLSDLRASAET